MSPPDRKKQRNSTKNILVACSVGDLESINLILSDVRLAKSELRRRDNHNWSALHHVVANGNIDCLRAMLASPFVSIDAKTFEGETALHLAVKRLSTTPEHIQLLLKAQPNLINEMNNEETSALQEAIDCKRGDLARCLIEIGKPNINHVDLDDENALFYAIRAADYATAEYLITQTTIDVTRLNISHLDCLSIDLFINAAVDTDQRTACLRLLFNRIFAPTGRLTSILTACINSIRMKHEQLNKWILLTFFENYLYNSDYADIIADICKTSTLSHGSKLALCIPLHQSVNPINGNPMTADIKASFENHTYVEPYYLYCLFTLMIDDFQTFQKCATHWLKFYLSFDAPNHQFENDHNRHSKVIVDMILSMSNGSVPYPIRLHCASEYIQFIKQLSFVPFLHDIIHMEDLFKVYVENIDDMTNVKPSQIDIMCALVMYTTQDVPYEVLCDRTDRLHVKQCNNIFRDTNDIVKNFSEYRKLVTAYDAAQPNTLFNLARTYVRNVVCANSKRTIHEPLVMNLWRLELPVEVRSKLIYQYTTNGIV